MIASTALRGDMWINQRAKKVVKYEFNWAGIRCSIKHVYYNSMASCIPAKGCQKFLPKGD
jgi:hypothetical protein